jgi:SAM-dependent methyltransferase
VYATSTALGERMGFRAAYSLLKPEVMKALVGRRHSLKLLGALALVGACGSEAPPALLSFSAAPGESSRFRRIYGDPALRGRFLLFLTHVFHLVPEHALHACIAEAARELHTDHEIYARIGARFPELGPALSTLRYALPALARQKSEMARQTAELVGGRVKAARYVEIGTPGRYVNALREHLPLGDEVYLVHTSEPSMSPEDIAERGQLSRVGSYAPLADYAPLAALIPRGKVDLITNYIGLHHAPRERLEPFVASIHEALRPGGLFVLRDHDVTDGHDDTLVALAHDVFNAGLGFPWSYNAAELRFFQSTAVTEAYLEARGFRRFGPRLAQAGDPTGNLLIAFERV